MTHATLVTVRTLHQRNPYFVGRYRHSTTPGSDYWEEKRACALLFPLRGANTFTTMSLSNLVHLPQLSDIASQLTAQSSTLLSVLPLLVTPAEAIMAGTESQDNSIPKPGTPVDVPPDHCKHCTTCSTRTQQAPCPDRVRVANIASLLPQRKMVALSVS